MFQTLTPNLTVEDVNACADFYLNTLGFELLVAVPLNGTESLSEIPPDRAVGFAMLKRDDVVVMLQSRASLEEDLPELAQTKIGSSISLYIKITALEDLYEAVRDKAKVVVTPRETFYGMREFAIEDPNGYLLIFAQELGG